MKFKIGDRVVSLLLSKYGETGIIKEYGEMTNVYLVDFKTSFSGFISQVNLILEEEYNYLTSDFLDKIKDRIK